MAPKGTILLRMAFISSLVHSFGSFAHYSSGNDDMINHEELLEDIRDDTNINQIPEKDLPKFGEPLMNVTVPVGREAILECVVDNLQTYKIAWLRVDTQTILTIQNHVITKNHRMSITHAEKRAWILRIRDVKESDKGWYMCQINTDPMKSQVGYLDVVVPPDILDDPTSPDMSVREGSNVTLKCAASGAPPPTITWRREGGEPIQLGGGKEVLSYNGSELNIARVNRLSMGPYLCIATNGIPPTVSKRVMLTVQFPPMIWIQNQLIGAAIGQTVSLECQSEAFPKSINYWMKNDSIIAKNERFSIEQYEKLYKIVMKLTIRSIEKSDFGSYKCLAKNEIGDTDGSIKLYEIPHTTMMTTVTPTAPLATTSLIHKSGSYKDKRPHHKPTLDLFAVSTNNILIGATSSLWNSPDAVKDRIPDHNYRSDSPSNSIQREADHLTDHEKSSSRQIAQNHQIAVIFHIVLSIIFFNLFV